MKAELLKYFSPEVAEFLVQEFEKMDEQIDDPCTDNYRFCRVGDPVTEEMYHTRKEEGCCGSEDRYVSYQGEIYQIGLNYGH